MSEFPEPQQESAAPPENRNIGPFRKGPKLMTTILFFSYLQNPGLEALRFKDPISKNHFGRVPANMKWEGPSSQGP